MQEASDSKKYKKPKLTKLTKNVKKYREKVSTISKQYRTSLYLTNFHKNLNSKKIRLHKRQIRSLRRIF